MVGTAAVCLALLAGAAGLLRSEYEKKHLAVETRVIPARQLKVRERTYVFLTDLHNHEFGPGNRDLIAAIHRAAPDAVLAGGDMMTCKGVRDVGPALKLLKELAGRYPVYHAYGNHESRMDRQRDVYGDQHDLYVKELKDCGVVLLRNGSVEEPEGVRISGIELDSRYYGKFRRAPMEPDYLKNKVPCPCGRQFQILMVHSPLYMKEYEAWGADLALAGHFHGGTIRLPVLGGVMTPQYQFFSPWCAGDFVGGKCRMIVGRGLGTHSINIRINNKPQLLVLKLKNETISG